MSRGPIRIMVDTNTWVDAFCQWHARADEAARLLREANRRGIELLYPVHCLKDALYILIQEHKRKALEEEGVLTESMSNAVKISCVAAVRAIMSQATAVGADGSDLWLADKYLSTHGDFEDNLVLAACQRAHVDYLVTNDQKLIQHANVMAKTPTDMVALLTAGQARPLAAGFAPNEISWEFRP